MRVQRSLGMFSVLTMLMVGSLDAQVEMCDTALTYAGRNELLSVSDKDVRAYYYQRICSATSAGFGLSAGDSTKDLLSQASRFLNINYSSKDEYCKQEQSFSSAHQFDLLKTSTVVERALDNWLECVRINRSGIVVRPDLRLERATFSIKRGGTGPGIISKVDADAGTRCRATVAVLPRAGEGQTGATVEVKELDLTKKGYSLSLVETLSLVCDRTAKASEAGGEVFPSTVITISTSEGPFNFRLREEPRAATKWATEIQARQDKLEQQLAEANRQLDSKIEGMKVAFTDCRQESYQRVGHEQPYSCPAGKVISSFSFHGSVTAEPFPSISFWCCSVSLQKVDEGAPRAGQ